MGNCQKKSVNNKIPESGYEVKKLEHSDTMLVSEFYQQASSSNQSSVHIPPDPYHTQDLMNLNFDNLCVFTFNGVITKAKVVDVYDGDTVTIVFYHHEVPVKYHFRMLGYDSPEMKPKKNEPNRELEIQAAQVAKHQMVNLTQNKLVWVKFTKEEKYGRLMGELFDIDVNSTDHFQGTENNINEYMVKNGFGKPYHGAKKDTFTEKELHVIIKKNNLK